MVGLPDAMAVARTAAIGQGGLDPTFLRLSSSLRRDMPLLREDILGSCAHAMGLSVAGLLRKDEALAIRDGLLQILKDVERDPSLLPLEEDIHMAVEALLTRRLPQIGGKLHTGRSRNDQIALDLRLHLREGGRLILAALSKVLSALVQLANDGLATLLPGYTHRQRAIPITVAHFAMAAAFPLLRDGELLCPMLTAMNRCPLGAGALAGSSLPLLRDEVARLLQFSGPTENSLDTISDRDFCADLSYLSSRIHGHLSRLCTDIIDFATAEFSLIELSPQIACGSSMMPHKKNPDLFELVRGRSAMALGDLVSALCLTKGLPLGYMRDLQEDRGRLTQLSVFLLDTLEMMAIGLANIRFVDRGVEMLKDDATQATDLAEVLVQQGVPFRVAYRAIGQLVALVKGRGQGLLSLRAEEIHKVLPEVGIENNAAAEVVRELTSRLDPGRCVAARDIPGGPAIPATKQQIAEVVQRSAELVAYAEGMHSLSGLLASL